MDNLELHAYLDQRRVLAESMRAAYVQQIKEGLEYYEGNLPAPFTRGGSSYVDRTVYDQVKGIAAQLNDTFMSADSVVKFRTKLPHMDTMAKIATNHINTVILEQNSGFNLLRESIHAALKEKASYLIPYWVQREEVFETEVSALTEEEVAAMAMMPGMELDLEQGVESGLFGGTVKYTMDTSGLEIDQVPFEHISIDHNARTWREANYLCRKINKIRGVFLEEGIDVHEDATFIDDMYSLKIYREDYNGGYVDIDNSDKKDVLRDYVTVYEHYINMELDGSFGWWKIVTDSIGVISKEQVEGHGIVRLEPLPSPFCIYGESIPDITRDLQTAMTMLIRGMFDNIMGTNHPQILALKGQYDHASLMNKQPNGIIEIKTPGAIEFVRPLPISGEIQLLYQMVVNSRDTRTGLSNAAQGLDDTIFKNDNAFATVQAVQTQALQRTKDIALNLAHGGFTDLFRLCYKQIRDNDTRTYDTVVNGRPLKYTPAQFPENMDVTVDTTISPSDKAVKAQALLQLFQMMNQVPVTQQMQLFGPEQQYNFIHEFGRALNFDNIGPFILPLEAGKPTQPSPLDVANLQVVQNEAILKQAQAMREQSVAQKNGADVQVNAQRLIFEQQKAASDDEIQEKKLAFEQDRSAYLDMLEKDKLILEKIKTGAEIQLEAEQKRAVAIGNKNS